MLRDLMTYAIPTARIPAQASKRSLKVVRAGVLPQRAGGRGLSAPGGLQGRRPVSLDGAGRESYPTVLRRDAGLDQGRGVSVVFVDLSD